MFLIWLGLPMASISKNTLALTNRSYIKMTLAFYPFLEESTIALILLHVASS